ncbi:hypothetical protein FQZ97_842730 [compost metagenome]
MPLGAANALCQQLLLQHRDQLAVLRMHRRHGAEFQRTLEALHQDLVVGHDRVLVGHEVLEAVHAVLVHQRAHVLVHAVVPPGHGHVKAVVAGGFLGPAAPHAKGVHQRLLRVGNHEVDDAGGATGQARRRAAEEVVGRHGAHEGQLHVGVRVDAAGHHVGAAGVDHLGARRHLQVGADLEDLVPLAEHVGTVLGIGVDHRAAANEYGHGVGSFSFLLQLGFLRGGARP